MQSQTFKTYQISYLGGGGIQLVLYLLNFLMKLLTKNTQLIIRSILYLKLIKLFETIQDLVDHFFVYVYDEKKYAECHW